MSIFPGSGHVKTGKLMENWNIDVKTGKISMLNTVFSSLEN